MKYPTSIKTDNEKLEYLYRYQEKLRLEHNEKGKDFREGRLARAAWDDYKINQFRPLNCELGELLAPLRSLKADPLIEAELAKGAAKPDAISAALEFKESMKMSTKHDSIIELGK